ncbi:DNA repair helicase RHP51 [Ceratobasidium sp. AG-Ba]|nr:DNA repair helicase RHP51 [Ceratobasidium sp. AG-Ba]
MDLPTTAQIPELSDQTRTLLAKGPNLKNYIDIVTLSASDLATKLHVPLERAQTVLKHVHAAYAPVTTLVDLENSGSPTTEDIAGRTFTTGDEGLDNLLGGGIVVGQITEITGEAAGGKSQLALQLSLSVQLPEAEGGLEGSALYLTTLNRLSTSRLLDMIKAHPILANHHPATVTLDNISTQHASDVDKLTVLLTSLLPTHITACQARGTPLRLLVIDSLTAVFRDNPANRQASQSLYARSESLNAIGSLLQQIASTHGIAVVVINDVTDVFAPNPGSNTDSGELIYREQSRWFARAGGVAGEERHEAALGMVWSNHIHNRILLARTGRRRHLGHPRASEGDPSDEDAVLIRRIFFLFGKSVEDEVPAPSLDFIVCAQGVKTVL